MSQNITPTPLTDRPEPTREQIKKWRRYLAEEISEAKVYSQLAERSEGREAEILRKVAEAEHRHQQHWRNLLGRPDYEYWRFGGKLPNGPPLRYRRPSCRCAVDGCR